MSNKVISTDALIARFRQALSEGWGYIWGTAGVKWTAAKQKELEKTTDADRAQGRQYGGKWIGKTVADCSGLFSWAFKQLGGYMYHGSDTMYRKYCANKGELKAGKRTDRASLKPGTAVFVWNGRKYSHVGLYVGDNTVIEAMGTINGVTTTRVTASKWTHWGELAGVDYGNSQSGSASQQGGNKGTVPPVPAGTEGLSPTFRTLRKGDKGEAVTELQALLMKLGYDLGSYGVDGDFGKDTDAAVRRFQADHGLTVDGVVGQKTRTELEKAAGQEKEKTEEISYSVTIYGLDLTQAKAIVNNYPGSIMERSVG